MAAIRQLGAAALLAVVTLTGCSVSAGGDGSSALGDGADSPAAAAGASVLSIDLATPPSRADLGMRDGVTHDVVQAPDREPLDVAVTFSDGTVLETPADEMLLVAETADGPPVRAQLVRGGIDREDLPGIVGGVLGAFGADATEADAAVAEVLTSSTANDEQRSRSFAVDVAAPDGLQVEVSTARDGQVMLTYTLTWAA